MEESDLEQSAPVRVCRKCSTQAQTSGDFCPHCGARYAKKQRSRKTKIAMVGVPGVALVVAAIVAAVLIVHHNHQVAARKHAAHVAAVSAAKKKAAAEAAARAAARRQARIKAAHEKLLKAEAKLKRDELVISLQKAVQKDAEKDVNDGIFDGPIIKVQCQPATAVDATAAIANYSCLAATSQTGSELEGYRFSASINMHTESYSWHLGA